jgi:RNA polymerase sigma-70 factor, ECF subfamily
VDRDLVERAQRGDRAAYETVARASAQRLFLVCHRVLRDVDLAEDATQRTLVAIWRDLPGLRDPARFEAWSYRLAVRFSLEEARRDRRLGSSVRFIETDRPDAADPLGAVADRDALERAFGRLRPEQRAVVVLRYYSGLTLEEIGRVMQIPPGTVASRLHYALRGLRAAIEADESVPGLQKGLPA